jgi:DNA-binding NarL/FixJ family response regulator
MECVGEAQSGEEALELCQALQPQVVMVDLAMPGMGCVAAIEAVQAAFKQRLVNFEREAARCPALWPQRFEATGRAML